MGSIEEKIPAIFIVDIGGAYRLPPLYSFIIP
jgi:hypothetical protein